MKRTIQIVMFICAFNIALLLLGGCFAESTPKETEPVFAELNETQQKLADSIWSSGVLGAHGKCVSLSLCKNSGNYYLNASYFVSKSYNSDLGGNAMTTIKFGYSIHNGEVVDDLTLGTEGKAYLATTVKTIYFGDDATSEEKHALISQLAACYAG